MAKRGRIDDNLRLYVFVKGFDKFQRPPNGGAKGVDARFEPLEKATFKDANQRILAPQLKFILLAELVRFKAVVRQIEPLDTLDDGAIDTPRRCFPNRTRPCAVAAAAT